MEDSTLRPLRPANQRRCSKSSKTLMAGDPCAIKDRLFKILNESILNHHEASQHLADVSGVVDGGPAGDFGLVKRQCELASEISQQAREMYDDHIKSHGC